MTLGPLLALALSALPYPAPRLVQPTSATKCDRATVLLVDATKGELKGTTAAGVVTYRIAADVQVFDKDGQPLGPVSKLVAGQRVRVYYVVEDGARVAEVDVE